ncbi:Hsp20/alpha crystallin family protein [Candidatus Falkowbacteria bacterium]|nr:Hsp20/alpha crystallin family protein [Candidatus Falkowbacteria bacterium]
MSNFFKKIIGLDKKREIAESQINYEKGDPPTVSREEWLGEGYNEGQLSIDVYQTPENLIVKSTIAGVKPEDIDISLHNDMLTVRGKRKMEEEIKEENYLYKECFWGAFSRSIILPVEINPKKIKAFLENGVLTVILPKIKTAEDVAIKVEEK